MTVEPEERLAGRCLIVGAGMGGLAAAAAAAPFFDQIDIIDRDELPSTAQHRRGVAQSRQLHVLLKGGETFLEDLLPGILKDFAAAGACHVRHEEDSIHFERGYVFPQRDLGYVHLGLSRPAYEWVLRERVRRIPNVRIHERTPVEQLNVEGNVLQSVNGTSNRRAFAERADLFIFATGRNGALAELLAKAGLGPVPTTELSIDVNYTTGRFKKAARYKGDKKQVVCYPAPPHTALGLLFPIENDEWLIVLGGRGDARAPTELDGFRSYAKSLPIDAIADRVRDAEPVEPLRSFRVPTSTWWHYERLPGLPRRFIALGDCIASFNPTFGQGMSVAAGHAVALRDALAKSIDGEKLDKVAAYYFAKAAEYTAQAWNTAAIVDLEYPQTRGERSDDFDKRVAFSDGLRRAARKHHEVHKLRFEIGHLLSPVSALRDGPLAALITAELQAKP
jgi:2-polyprenyl-6-methoxyphenol hydroxylase-like FAD-dependent oxidoreductase